MIEAFLPLLSALSQAPGGPASDLRVEKVAAEVTLDPENAAFRARASLTVEGRGIDRIVFSVGESLAVETSRASAGIVEHRKRGSELIVDLDPPLDGPRTLTFALSGSPSRNGVPRVGPDRAVLGPEDGWIPSHPGMWATADVTIRAPRGWTAIGPGRQGRARVEGEWRWSSDRPLRSVAIAAAPGLAITEATRGPLTVRVASVPGGPNAESVALRVFPAVAWHSGAFAPYPFDGFNVAFVPGLDRRTRGSGFAVAPPGFSLETDADGAEMVSGQWFGERIGGDGAWIEAFAAWEPVVFARDRALPLPTETARQRGAYFALLSGDVALARAGLDAPEAVLRGKGSAVPDMVRLGIGDGPFFDVLRALFAAPPGPRLALAELRAAFAKAAPERAPRLFDDWFGKAGVPEIGATVRSMPTADGNWRNDVAVVQARGLYALPVELVLFGEEGAEKRETVEIEEAATPLVYVLPFRVHRVEVDPLGRIFRWR
jgi:hypothetical protein